MTSERVRCPSYIKSTNNCKSKPKGCQFGGYQFKKDGTRSCFREVKIGNPLSNVFFSERLKFRMPKGFKSRRRDARKRREERDKK